MITESPQHTHIYTSKLSKWQGHPSHQKLIITNFSSCLSLGIGAQILYYRCYTFSKIYSLNNSTRWLKKLGYPCFPEEFSLILAELHFVLWKPKGHLKDCQMIFTCVTFGKTIPVVTGGLQIQSLMRAVNTRILMKKVSINTSPNIQDLWKNKQQKFCHFRKAGNKLNGLVIIMQYSY